MKINGQEITDVKTLFPNINCDELPEDLEETQSQKGNILAIKESNIKGNIPNRFANTTFINLKFAFTEELRKYALEPKDKVVLLMGGVGTGKTSLLVSAMHERAVNELECGLYFSTVLLMPTLRTCRSFSAKETEKDFIERLANTPFLCYDEFGACTNTKEEAEFASTIIKMRYDNALPTMIATNLSPSNFKLFLGGIERGNMTSDQVKKECEKLEATNPTLNRIMSITKAYIIQGESHRGDNND